MLPPIVFGIFVFLALAHQDFLVLGRSDVGVRIHANRPLLSRHVFDRGGDFLGLGEQVRMAVCSRGMGG